jgi:tetratricopeptide (TPR) repeat protein/transcriptional regulator with XRE-family HTH domain
MAPTLAATRLGQELRRLRRRNGMSQRALVRALGLSAHSNLVQYELGRRIPPGDIVAACERLLGDEAGSLRRLRSEALAERAAEPAPGENTPAMLPASVADFTGREAQLRELATGDGNSVVVTGTAGVGKTALAVRFGHQVAADYPDGQLYLDLRGHALTAPLSSRQALGLLLHALGVPSEEVPADTDRATGMYRSLLAGKRTLVVLDNAHKADQVRPLLPGTPNCLVVVTSRNRLGGLIARDGARRLVLDVLTPAEAETLLARIVGADRIEAEADAAADLARYCAYLPLALRIAAANLVDEPHRRIGDYVSALHRGDPLDALTVAGDEKGAVRVVFSPSYRRLPADARRLFRRVGLVPGPDLTAAAAAALISGGESTAVEVLNRLVVANLLTEPVPGRFTCHDLLRQYAADRALHDETDEERRSALDRLYGWYLTNARGAAQLLYPTSALLPMPDTEVFEDAAQALAWVEAERGNLYGAVQHAAAYGPHDLAWQLADALRGYFWLRLHTADWMATARAALAAAQAKGDRRAEAACRLSLADAYQSQGHNREALNQYAQVLTLTRESDWVEGQVATLNSLGRVYWQLDRLEEAADSLSQALDIDRAAGSVRGQATRLANIGAIYHEMGRLRPALDHFTEALAITERTGQQRGEAICLANIGMACHELGLLDTAFDHLDRALSLAREIGDSGNESHVLRVFAEAYSDTGRDTRALEFARAAVAVADEIDDRSYQLDALNTLAEVQLRLGNHEAAIGGYRHVLKLARENQNRYAEIVALVGLSGARQSLGEAREAVRLAKATGYRLLEGNARTAIAAAYRALGSPDHAARHARQALQIHRHTGQRIGEARTLLVLGHALHSTGATDAAAEAWQQAYELFTGIGAREADEVRTLLAG